MAILVIRYCWRCAAPLAGVPPVTCDVCGQEHYNNPRPTAGAVVLRDDSILLVRRAHDPYADHWDVPGGYCEAGEHPRDAAERELMEETGYRARCGEFLGMWMDEYGPPEPDGMRVTTLNNFFMAELVEPEPVGEGDTEISDMRWFPLDALPQEIAFPRHSLPMLQTVQRRF